MLYLSSYAVFLFTIQLILILSKAPVWWLLTIWGLLFFYVYTTRRKFYFPQDHPRVWERKRAVMLWLVALLFLASTHLYFSYYMQKNNVSNLAVYLENFSKQTSSAKASSGSATLLSIEETFFVTGLIHSPLTTDGNRVSYMLLVNSINDHRLPRPEKIMVHHYVQEKSDLDRYAQVSRRDYWAGSLRLAEPPPARNPGAFDYQQFLARQQIYFVGRAQGDSWVYQANPTWSATLFTLLDNQREKWLTQVEQVFSAEVASLVQAMTIGYRDTLEPELVEMYQQLGIIHILAISGLHVGIILWGLFRLLSLLPLTREKMYAILLLFLPVYMYLSGGQVSAVRAGLMGMIALLFLRLRWWRHALQGLYAVYILMLLYNPFYIYHVGFQLSFAVTFILIVAYPTLENTLTFLPTGMRQVVGIALLAQLVSLPIILVHFYQFSPWSMFLNLLIVPIYSFIFIPGAFLLILLSYVHVDLTTFFVLIYEHLLTSIHQGLMAIQTWPFSILSTGRPSLWWLGIYIGIVILFFIQLEREKFRQAWVNLCFILFMFILLPIAPYLERQALVTVLDVGQGEAILLELPKRQEVVLIDLGGTIHFPREEWAVPRQEFEVGRDVILPYLRYRGINTLDKVIITHGHFDHYGGIQGLLGKVKIKQVLRSPIYPHSATEQGLFEKVTEVGIPVYSLGEGDSWGGNDYFFYVVFPEKQESLVKNVANVHDYNLVIWTKIHQSTFIWTGDVEEYGERIITEKYPELKADILNIAHHGSQTSTGVEWLKQMQAKVGLISVGKNNRYAHPHDLVLERLSAENIAVLRTDQHGGIRIVVGPDNLVIIPTLQ